MNSVEVVLPDNIKVADVVKAFKSDGYDAYWVMTHEDEESGKLHFQVNVEEGPPTPLAGVGNAKFARKLNEDIKSHWDAFIETGMQGKPATTDEVISHIVKSWETLAVEDLWNTCKSEYNLEGTAFGDGNISLSTFLNEDTFVLAVLDAIEEKTDAQ